MVYSFLLAVLLCVAMTATVGAGWLLSQVVCAALVFISGPQKDTQEKWLRGM